jgi:hypothetical protein
MKKQIMCRLSPESIIKLDLYTSSTGINRSRFVRELIDWYLDAYCVCVGCREALVDNGRILLSGEDDPVDNLCDRCCKKLGIDEGDYLFIPERDNHAFRSLPRLPRLPLPQK